MTIEFFIITATADAFARRAIAIRQRADLLCYSVTASGRDIRIVPGDAAVMFGTAQLLDDIAADVFAMLPPAPMSEDAPA